jgi:glycosyltransferase involved in cell wall biosynthesis
VEALVLARHEVEVICLRGPGEPGFERRGQVTVRRVPLRISRASRANYLLAYGAFFMVAMAITATRHLRHRFDLVQVNTLPDFLVFAAIVPRLLGARVLLDLQESTPEFYAVKFGTGLRHPWVRLLAWVEQVAIRFADRAITCTDQMREAFQSRGAPPHKMDVIMNSSNEDEFDSRRYPPAKHAAGEFRLICHGTIQPIFGIDTIVRAVALLRDEIPGLHLDIIGDGSALPEIRALVRALDLAERVYLSGRYVPLDELVQAIANADAGVVALRRNIFRDLMHSNKMFDFITMGKPAIVSRTRSVEAYFDDSCLQLFNAGDEYDLARAIRELHADPDRRDRLVRQATRRNEPYRWPYQRARYQAVVDNLIGNRGSAPATAPIGGTELQGRAG